MIGLDWLTGRAPLTTKELLSNTDKSRIEKSKSVIIESYTNKFIIKEMGLFQKIKSFFTKDPVNVTFVKFYVTTKNAENGNKYRVILVVPYLKNMSAHTLSNLPIQVYSSTPDFKYRFAYNLNKHKNVYLDDDIRKELGIALTEKPTKVGSSQSLDSVQLDKHLYKVLTNIDKLKIKY